MHWHPALTIHFMNTTSLEQTGEDHWAVFAKSGFTISLSIRYSC